MARQPINKAAANPIPSGTWCSQDGPSVMGNCDWNAASPNAASATPASVVNRARVGRGGGADIGDGPGRANGRRPWVGRGSGS